MRDFTAAVKQYAREHYNEGGWDSIVECWDDNELRDVIGNAKTEQQAIKRVEVHARLFNERRMDAEAEIF